MRVRMLVHQAGPRVDRPAGAEVEVSSAEGARLCAAGQAVPVRRRARREQSVKRPPLELGETTTRD